MTKLQTFGRFIFAPARSRKGGSVEKLSLSRMASGVFVFCLAAAIASPAKNTFTTLVTFDVTNGASPNAGLVQGIDGNFYGTTTYGGAHNNCTGGCGTIFKVTPAGTLTTLYSFCSKTGCADGELPNGELLLGTDGNFYGTTTYGGNPTCNGGNGCGTVFKITPGGTLTTLHSFAGHPTDGGFPKAGLVQSSTNGSFYGTTPQGGANDKGTIFKITPAGTLTMLHSFEISEGTSPNGLVEATTGYYIYGTTSGGGANSDGTAFKITPGGQFWFLHSFDGTDGAFPYAEMVQGSDGNFYGTTDEGGANCGAPGCGTVFKFVLAPHTFTALHSFAGYPTDGGFPRAGLVQGTDASFYGTTAEGGANCGTSGCGTIFKITPPGTLTTLYSFCAQTGCPDGELPDSGLVQGTDGNFYGTATEGGAGHGTVFRLGVGLGPFVKTLATFGKVGATVIILGTNLTGATGVSFNGSAATFKVVSNSEITATVPAGATTGKVQVTTPSSGTLKTRVVFHLTPQILSFTPTSGAVGTPVQITGVSLTQTGGITFGGVNATTFTVNSDTQVTATVPIGATTGKIVVNTLGGSATSATSFTVTP